MTGPNHMWQKHVSGSCVGHGRFGGHLIRYSSFLIQSFKSTVPFGSAPRRINSLTANHRVLHDCINRWDKQNKPGDFNQRIFESLLWAENFWEEMFTLLESGSEPLKSWKSLIMPSWMASWATVTSCAPFPGISRRHTQKQGSSHSWMSTEFSVHRPCELCPHCGAFQQRHRQTANREELWFCVSPRDERIVVFRFPAIRKKS